MTDETFETIDLTDPEQVRQDPIISEILPDQDEEQAIEETELTEAAASEDTTETGDDPETPEEQPAEDLTKMIAALDGINSVIDALNDRIDKVTEAVAQLVELEQKRAAGPQGFFKPLDQGGSEDGPLPRIERIYK